MNFAAAGLGGNAGAAASPPLDLTIYPYPFDGEALADFMDIGDLDPAESYAIVLPATEASGNRVYLWIGGECELTESDVTGAFQSNLVVPAAAVAGPGEGEAEGGLPSIRLHSGAVLQQVSDEVVHEGEEPNDLLLVLD